MRKVIALRFDVLRFFMVIQPFISGIFSNAEYLMENSRRNDKAYILEILER
jgi:hypothetical protein